MKISPDHFATAAAKARLRTFALSVVVSMTRLLRLLDSRLWFWRPRYAIIFEMGSK